MFLGVDYRVYMPKHDTFKPVKIDILFLQKNCKSLVLCNIFCCQFDLDPIPWATRNKSSTSPKCKHSSVIT